MSYIESSKKPLFQKFTQRSPKLVFVRFLDHVIFKNVEPCCQPILRETIGWLIDENECSITLLWVREPENGSPQVRRATGICILKSDIIEIREVKVT